jgi:hypothetical protein
VNSNTVDWQMVAEQAKATHSTFFSGQQMTAASAVLGGGMPGINQFLRCRTQRSLMQGVGIALYFGTGNGSAKS